MECGKRKTRKQKLWFLISPKMKRSPRNSENSLINGYFRVCPFSFQVTRFSIDEYTEKCSQGIRFKWTFFFWESLLAILFLYWRVSERNIEWKLTWTISYTCKIQILYNYYNQRADSNEVKYASFLLFFSYICEYNYRFVRLEKLCSLYKIYTCLCHFDFYKNWKL